MQALYEMLEYIANEWHGKVCVFGAGRLGTGEVYKLLDMTGIKIDCYIDNYVEPGTKIREGIFVKPPEYLYEHANDYYVVACFGSGISGQIEKQLLQHGIINYSFIHKDNINHFYNIELKDAPLRIRKRYLELYDDEFFLAWKYKERTGEDLDLCNPKSFNEKLQWMKINYRDPQMIDYVDKSKAKKRVAKKIGEKYIIPTLAEWNRFEDIDFDFLPERFVLKCTHDSGSVAICKDKNSFDVEKTKALFERALKINYYWGAREWQYKYIHPKIIAEEFIGDGIEDINDYKIFCFDGVPKMIQVDYDRFGNHRRNLYTTDWQYIEGSILYPTDKEHIIEKPANLDEMLRVASVLSEGFIHVRVDLYNYAGRVYFGEMTFTHGAGYEQFTPPELGIKLGNYIKLPTDDNNAYDE